MKAAAIAGSINKAVMDNFIVVERQNKGKRHRECKVLFGL
jgi:hypothetical protein